MIPSRKVAERYLERARELRIRSARVKDLNNREIFIRAAQGYERMAAWTRSGLPNKT